MPLSPHPMIAFIHMFKTGGTTITGILRRNFSVHHFDTRLIQDKPAITADQLRRAQRIYPRIDSLAGHAVRTTSDLRQGFPDLRFYTFMRKPQPRLLSAYIFARSTQMKRGHWKPGTPLEIEADFQKFLTEFTQAYTSILGADAARPDIAIEALERDVGFVGLVLTIGFSFVSDLVEWRKLDRLARRPDPQLVTLQEIAALLRPLGTLDQALHASLGPLSQQLAEALGSRLLPVMEKQDAVLQKHAEALTTAAAEMAISARELPGSLRSLTEAARAANDLARAFASLQADWERVVSDAPRAFTQIVGQVELAGTTSVSALEAIRDRLERSAEALDVSTTHLARVSTDLPERLQKAVAEVSLDVGDKAVATFTPVVRESQEALVAIFADFGTAVRAQRDAMGDTLDKSADLVNNVVGVHERYAQAMREAAELQARRTEASLSAAVQRLAAVSAESARLVTESQERLREATAQSSALAQAVQKATTVFTESAERGRGARTRRVPSAPSRPGFLGRLIPWK